MNQSTALLILLVLILSLLSACNQNSSPLSTIVETTNNTTTPPITLETYNLQRPPIDEYVIITGPLTPGEPPTPPETDPYNGYATYIPYGSIVYHWANGITEVFGPDEKRILIAKDSEAAQIPTPAGEIASATKVLQVPSGAHVMHGEDGLTKIIKVYFNSEPILTVIDSPDNYGTT